MEFSKAFEFVQQQTRRTIQMHPGLHPMYTSGGRWDRCRAGALNQPPRPKAGEEECERERDRG